MTEMYLWQPDLHCGCSASSGRCDSDRCRCHAAGTVCGSGCGCGGNCRNRNRGTNHHGEEHLPNARVKDAQPISLQILAALEPTLEGPPDPAQLPLPLSHAQVQLVEDGVIAATMPTIATIQEHQIVPARLNLLPGRRRGATRTQPVPGSNMCSTAVCVHHSQPTMHHCAACWQPDDHTMIWCRRCNKHLHASDFEDPDVAEEVHNTEGWVCDECEKTASDRDRR